jgi:hypothetical protein
MGVTTADRLASDQPGRTQALQDPSEHGPMRLKGNQPTRPRNRRVIGRRLIQSDTQKIAQRQRVGGAPRDAALRVKRWNVSASAAVTGSQ